MFSNKEKEKLLMNQTNMIKNINKNVKSSISDITSSKPEDIVISKEIKIKNGIPSSKGEIQTVRPFYFFVPRKSKIKSWILNYLKSMKKEK